MKPVDFPQSNALIGEGQPEYLPLPAYIAKEVPGSPVYFCNELSVEELKEIVETGRVWYTQLTFGGPFQPVQLSTQSPFLDRPEVRNPLSQLPSFLYHKIHEAIGAASMCWSETPSGEYESMKAAAIAKELVDLIAAAITTQSIAGTKQ